MAWVSVTGKEGVPCPWGDKWCHAATRLVWLDRYGLRRRFKEIRSKYISAGATKASADKLASIQIVKEFVAAGGVVEGGCSDATDGCTIEMTETDEELSEGVTEAEPVADADAEEREPKRRGRPPGSKTKRRSVVAAVEDESVEVDEESVLFGEPTRRDVLWAAHAVSDPSKTRKDAPSQLAWTMTVQARNDAGSWRDLQKLVTSGLFGKDVAEDDGSLDRTGMPDAIREGFGELWGKVRPLVEDALPDICGRS